MLSSDGTGITFMGGIHEQKICSDRQQRVVIEGLQPI